jgi:hypothetical protein
MANRSFRIQRATVRPLGTKPPAPATTSSNSPRPAPANTAMPQAPPPPPDDPNFGPIPGYRQ